jgi:RNA ligase
MVTIYDIAPAEMWDAAFAAKHINRQVHPDPAVGLEIYDYSQVCQFARAWTPATLASRGLIVDAVTKEVKSRPMGKFFNYGEPDVNSDWLTGPVTVTDKLDGSMGESYLNPLTGKLNVSTRGSFASDQAVHATERYLELYDGHWEPVEGETYIWEIIYPTNRIVLNYGDLDDLVLVTRVNNETGHSVPPSEVEEWLWRKAEQFPFTSLTEALAAEPRPNAEGFVVHFRDSDLRVKIKQEDYINMHRVITGASSRRIWEILAAGQDLESWLVDQPDEFVVFVETTRDKLIAEHAEKRAELEAVYASVIAGLPEGFSQKEFAVAVQVYPELRGMLFSRHRNEERTEKNLSDSIWKMIRPEFEKPFWNLNGKVDEEE